MILLLSVSFKGKNMKILIHFTTSVNTIIVIFANLL